MPKRNKVKTTLDKRHKDKVNTFESNDELKSDLEQDLANNLKN